MSYLEGVLIYIFILFIICLFSNIPKTNEQKKLCIFSFILLSLFSGLSYDVGWDYITYRYDIISGNIERYEFLERELMRISENIPQLFFIINHTIIVGLTMWIIYRYSTNKLLSIIAFICFPYQFLFGLSTIRAALMVAVVFSGYMYFLYEKNNPLLFILTLIIGFFIHQAALGGILLLCVHYLKLGWWSNLAIIIVSFFASFIKINLNVDFLNGISVFEGVSSKLEYYTNNSEYGGGQMIHYCFLILSILGIIFYKKIEQSNVAKISLTMVSVGYFIAALFQQSPVLASRFSRFFYVFNILLIPYYVYALPRVLQKVAKMVLLCTLTALLLYQLSIHNYNGVDFGRVSTYWPYKTIMEVI